MTRGSRHMWECLRNTLWKLAGVCTTSFAGLHNGRLGKQWIWRKSMWLTLTMRKPQTDSTCKCSTWSAKLPCPAIYCLMLQAESSSCILIWSIHSWASFCRWSYLVHLVQDAAQIMPARFPVELWHAAIAHKRCKDLTQIIACDNDGHSLYYITLPPCFVDADMVWVIANVHQSSHHNLVVHCCLQTPWPIMQQDLRP